MAIKFNFFPFMVVALLDSEQGLRDFKKDHPEIIFDHWFEQDSWSDWCVHIYFITAEDRDTFMDWHEEY